MQFVDAAKIAGTRMTSDGYLVAEVRTARTGIQDYAGYEVGKAAMPVVKVYRPPEQVFSKDSLGSYAHKPVTNDHPAEAVTADNWKKLSVGQIGDEVARDGDFVRIPLVLMDAATIKQVQDGKRELSAGYVCALDWTAGKTPDGQEYDAIQKDIRINHVAIVDRGRAGSEARIGDGAKWGIAPMHVDDTTKGQRSMTTRTITVDGLSVELADKDAQIVQRTLDGLTTKLADAEKRVADADTAHKTEIAAKDAEIAKKDAELDAIKAKVLSDADIDKRVQDRAGLITTAQAIAKDLKTDGLSDADIRKAAVVAKLGDEAIKDKSAEYIAVRFDILADEAKKADPVRDALMNRDSNNLGDDASKARAKMIADMQTAHVAQAK